MGGILGRVTRVRHELKFRDVEVAAVHDVTPHLRAVTFTGEALADFTSPAFDDHVKLYLDLGDAQPLRRDYTPRRFDPVRRTLTLEFVLHGDGPAAAWATRATPGQTARIAGPRGSFVVPTDYDWHLLLGDETAWPAIARRLEELPAGARVSAWLLSAHGGERPPMPTAADVQWTWAVDEAEQLAQLSAWALPAGEGYAWAAGEAAHMAEVRRVLVDDKGHDKRAIRAAAYWKRGAVGAAETEN